MASKSNIPLPHLPVPPTPPSQYRSSRHLPPSSLAAAATGDGCMYAWLRNCSRKEQGAVEVRSPRHTHHQSRILSRLLSVSGAQTHTRSFPARRCTGFRHTTRASGRGGVVAVWKVVVVVGGVVDLPVAGPTSGSGQPQNIVLMQPRKKNFNSKRS